MGLLNTKPWIAVLAGVFGLALGCSSTSSIMPDRRPDYKASKAVDPLEIPPDLTRSTIDESLVVPELNPTGSASFSDYSSERGIQAGQPGQGVQQGVVVSESVLGAQAGVRLERDGSRRWLVVEQPPEVVWPRVKSFWSSNGLLLQRDDARIGVMETEWAENRADIADGPIRSVLSKVIDFAYASPTRDKFRVRLERVSEGSEVYLTHYGMEEVTRGRGRQATDTVWQVRPRDPELEAEMLNRLMVHLGASERRADAQLAQSYEVQSGPKVRMIDYAGTQKAVVIGEGYSRAWSLVGLALDGSNFVVENQNRSQGLYEVEYRDPYASQGDSGFLSKFAFWKDKPPPPEGARYKVRLAGRGAETLVVVQNSAGQPDDSAEARLILDTLVEVIQ
jgi:outer membrane protein assembly factor BamC